MKLFILFLCFTLSLCGNYHENKLWGQPCLDDNTVASTSKSAEEVVLYSKWILEQLDSYKDEFIRKMEEYESFAEYVGATEGGKVEWLRSFYWYIEEILPKEKRLGFPLSDQYIEDMKARTNRTDDVIGKINAAIKFLEGSFYKLFQNKDKKELIKKDVDFGHTVRESMRIIRSIICSMNNYLRNKNFHIFVLLDDFLPNGTDYAGVLLRDSFNYFEYIKQLFDSLMHEQWDN